MERTGAGMNLICSFSDNRLAALELNNSGHKKYLRVDFDDAIADFSKALDLDPNLAVAYYNRGTVHYRLGNYKDALRDLKKSVELEPQNPEFLEGLRDCRKMYSQVESPAGS